MKKKQNILKRLRLNWEHRRDRCWLCGGRLCWQNDWDYEDYYGEGEGEGIVSILDCMNCGATVIYSQRTDDEKEELED